MEFSDSGAKDEKDRSALTESFLLREIHHRVANMLTLLAIGLRRELAPFRDPDLKDALARHERQIVELSQLYRLLGSGAEGGERSTEAHFRPLIEALFRSVLEPAGIRGEAYIVDGVLEGGQCVRLALIVTELVINAAKHAFRGKIGGTVRVTLAQAGSIWLCSVADDGSGLEGPSPRGGSQIVATLVETLKGKMRIRSGSAGTLVSIAFPIPAPESEEPD